jgi:hypothetical protein
MKHVKKIVLWTLVAFFIYAVITSPGQAADIVQNAWDLLLQGFKNIGSFFNSILNRNHR